MNNKIRKLSIGLALAGTLNGFAIADISGGFTGAHNGLSEDVREYNASDPDYVIGDPVGLRISVLPTGKVIVHDLTLTSSDVTVNSTQNNYSVNTTEVTNSDNINLEFTQNGLATSGSSSNFQELYMKLDNSASGTVNVSQTGLASAFVNAASNASNNSNMILNLTQNSTSETNANSATATLIDSTNSNMTLTQQNGHSNQLNFSATGLQTTTMVQSGNSNTATVQSEGNNTIISTTTGDSQTLVLDVHNTGGANNSITQSLTGNSGSFTMDIHGFNNSLNHTVNGNAALFNVTIDGNNNTQSLTNISSTAALSFTSSITGNSNIELYSASGEKNTLVSTLIGDNNNINHSIIGSSNSVTIDDTSESNGAIDHDSIITGSSNDVTFTFN
jgi:hypothetical protein